MSPTPARSTPALTLEWLGCATFRVAVKGLTLFFDTFVDRVPSAEPVGVRSDEVTRADFVFISHAHLDHILGADVVAKNTGAPVIGSYEAIRVLRENGVPAEQLWPVSGGETIDCGRGASVSVLPALHSCIWAAGTADAGAARCGELAVPYQERQARTERALDALHAATAEISDYVGGALRRVSLADGGQLNYLLRSPEGSILVSASAGYWSGIVRDLRPDVAVLSIAGRPNLDGEPFQGSMAQFVAGEVAALRPRRVVFCHHDAWLPPLPAIDAEPVAHELAARTPTAQPVTLGYSDPVAILRSLGL
jgi:L-ascorbate metabolism protein UlaG (beta-lactamase superfamily)